MVEGGRSACVVVVASPAMVVGSMARLSASTSTGSIGLLEDAMRLVDILLLRSVEGKLGSCMLAQSITKLPLRRLEKLLNPCTLRLGCLDSLSGACNGLGGLIDSCNLSVEAESVLPTGPQRTDAFAPKSSIVGSRSTHTSITVIDFTCSRFTASTIHVVIFSKAAFNIVHAILLWWQRRGFPRSPASRQPGS